DAVRHVHLRNHDAAGMQVRADAVRRESLSHGFAGYRPEKTAAAVAHVENHAAPARLEHVGLQLAAESVEHLDVHVVVHVRVDIAWTHDVEQLLAGGPA